MEHQVQQVKPKQENYVPYINLPMTKLPSKGKCYPDQAKISYRGYLFGEIQQISGGKNHDMLDMFANVMVGIEVEGMDKDQITFPDLLYTAILRKMSTLGSSEFSIGGRCRKCGEDYDRVFSQIDLSFSDLEIDGDHIELEVESGDKLVFTPLTYSDIQRLNSGKLLNNKKDLMHDSVANFAIMCRNHTFNNAYNIINKLSHHEDIENMNEIDHMLSHGLKPLKHKCDACEFENTIVLEGRDSFITPFRSGGEANRHKLRVGKRAVPQPLSHKVS